MRYGYRKVDEDGRVSWELFRFGGPVLDEFPEIDEASAACREVNEEWERYFVAALSGVAISALDAESVVRRARAIATAAVELPVADGSGS